MRELTLLLPRIPDFFYSKIFHNDGAFFSHLT